MSTTSPISPWMDTPPEATAALAEDLDVDVAVIGAGYTGLSTAIALRREGKSVAVLEREIAGYGASGRNAGHLTPTIGKDLPSLLTFYGREKTQRLVKLAEDAIAHVERTIAEHAIDCAYVARGNVMAAVHDSHRPRIEKAARVADDLGLQVTFLGNDQMRERGLPQAFTCGYLESTGGTLDPGRYVQGLRRVALDAGALLFENTPMLTIDDGPRLTVHTPGGRVRADHAVLATNAFTTPNGWLRSVSMPLHVSLFRTAPLTREHRGALNWDGGEGVYTTHEILESYRLTDDGRIVGGSKTVRYGFGNQLLPDDHPPTFAFLEAMFRDRFPELRDLPIDRYWSGPIGLTLDFLPAFGRTGSHRNIHYGIGYAGHGVALASYAGGILTDMICGRETPGDILIDRFRPPLPPEPFRWCLAQGLIKGMSALDRRLDRKVAQARGR